MIRYRAYRFERAQLAVAVAGLAADARGNIILNRSDFDTVRAVVKYPHLAVLPPGHGGPHPGEVWVEIVETEKGQ